MSAPRPWYEITPDEALERGIELPHPDVIGGPLNEMGEPCPWPWDPPRLAGQPMGQYHCPWCGAMVVAGIPHVDYSDAEDLGEIPVPVAPEDGDN